MRPYRLQEVRLTLVRSERPSFSIHRPEDVAKAFRDLTSNPRESFYALFINNANELVCFEQVSTGSASETIASPAEIVRSALLCNTVAIVVVHNHPSGDPRPSRADQEITEHLTRAAKLFQLTIIDHVIIGTDGRYFSFRQRNLLPAPTTEAPTTVPPETFPPAPRSLIPQRPLTPPAPRLHQEQQLRLALA